MAENDRCTLAIPFLTTAFHSSYVTASPTAST
jgi:hypothetical protein